MRLLLVSANVGGIDPPLPLPPMPAGMESAYHTDGPGVNATWTRVHRVPPGPEHPRLRAKWYKCQVHRTPGASGADVLAWADASLRFRSLEFLWDRACRLPADGSEAALVPHPDRATAAEEYDYVLDQLARGNEYLSSRYDAPALERERAHFEERHDLSRVPLWCGGLWAMANAPRTRAFLDAWWATVLRFSILDQPVMGALLAEHGISAAPIRVNVYRNEHFERVVHA